MKKLTLMLLLSVAIGSDEGKASPSAECTVSALQQKAPPGTTITAATVVAAEGATPEYCRVDGHVATPGNTVNFRLGLPPAWNGKFFFEGVGGFARHDWPAERRSRERLRVGVHRHGTPGLSRSTRAGRLTTRRSGSTTRIAART